MRLLKIVGLAVGALVLVLAIIAAYGVPAGGMIESHSRDALAKQELRLDIGNARLAILPTPSITIEELRLRDATNAEPLVTVERVKGELSLGTLVSGRLHVKDLALTRPVVQGGALSDRARRTVERRDGGGATKPAAPVLLPTDSDVAIDSIIVENGAVILRDGREAREVPVESLRIASLPAAGGRSSLQLDARSGATRLRMMAGLENAARLVDGQAIPIEATIEAPGVLKTPASLTATLTKSGPVLRVDGLNGSIDHGRVRGTMSISFAGAKPFVDAALESERIDLTSLVDAMASPGGASGRAIDARDGRAAAPGGSASARAGQPWSEAPLSLFGLRLVEGSVNLAAREVLAQKVRVAPASIEATLLHDQLTVKLSPSGVYGGQAAGEFVLDRSRDEPTLALRLAFAGLDALPFLRDAADFQYVSGRARGAVDVKGAGASPARIVANLNGRAELLFENGAVRGLNLPNMVRSLVDMVIAGWQAKASEETRFSTFGASFAIENGVARSTDVKFTGPFVVMTAAGSADLRAQTLDFRADPKLVSGPEAPGGGRSAPWSIGVPVAIQGPWSEPRIYADMPNILANPESALRALRDALGGAGGGGGGASGGVSGGSGSGGGSGGGQAEAPLGKFIEGLSKKFGQPGGDPVRDGGAIADEMLKALSGATRGMTAPQPETTAPRAAAPPPQPPRPAPPPPDRDLERGAREFLRDLLGR